MRVEDSYISAVLLLDEIFTAVKETGELAPLLGSMDPYLCGFGENIYHSPIDPAKGEDWRDILKSLNITEENISSEDAFRALIAYLEFYRDEFGFDLQQTIDLLNEMKVDPIKHKDLWAKWDLYVEKAPEYKVKI